MIVNLMLPPAVIVHGAEDVRRALGTGRRATLLSAAGAGCYGGARWWRLVADQGAAAFPGLVAADILDCGADAGRAVEALREGCRIVVLDPVSRAFDDVAGRAAAIGASVAALAPPALDMASPSSERRLVAWLDGAGPIR